MNRLIAILLCLCSAVVCAFVAYLGYQSTLKEQSAPQSPPAIACGELLKRIPDDLQRLRLTDFKGGRHYVKYDNDNDGNWDRVFVPTFPEKLGRLKQNYRAVIICFADVANEEQLADKLNSPEIEAEYWYSTQHLDQNTYNQLAENYISMDFDRSVILRVGFPPGIASQGNIMFWGASAGLLLSMLAMGWQTFGLLLAGLRKESEEPDDDDTGEFVITNRAELPTK